MPDLNDLVCPLCLDILCHDFSRDVTSIENYCSDKRRDYYQCSQCRLVFVPPFQYLTPEQEKAHYDLHQNSPDDQAYRQFLSRLAEPLIAELKTGMSGLDFGSGPGPTLSVMLEEAGFDMAIYDVFYANAEAVLQIDYDFVTATEVIEHLSKPGEVLEQLWSKIKPGGWFGLMTKMVLDKAAFNQWHYKNDQTHICFYSRETFKYLGEKWGASIQFPANDVILMQKK